MKHTRRILSFVLALVMVFALCAPALADRSYEPYKYYMCVGDSIAAGCALTKDGSETYFLRYSEFIPILWAKVREQEERLKRLEESA